MPVVCTYIHTNILLFRIYACMCVCENWAAGKKLLTHTKEKTLLDLPDCLWLRARVRLLSQRARERQRVRESYLVRERVRLGPAQRSVCSTLFSIILFACVLSWSSTECSAYESTHTYRKRDIYIYIHVCMCTHRYVSVCVCMHVYYMYIFVVLIWLGQKSAPLYGVFLVSGTTLKTTEQKNKRTHIRNIYATIFKYSTCLCVRVCEIFLIKNEMEPRKKCAKKNICKIYKIVIIIIIII